MDGGQEEPCQSWNGRFLQWDEMTQGWWAGNEPPGSGVDGAATTNGRLFFSGTGSITPGFWPSSRNQMEACTDLLNLRPLLRLALPPSTCYAEVPSPLETQLHSRPHTVRTSSTGTPIGRPPCHMPRRRCHRRFREGKRKAASGPPLVQVCTISALQHTQLSDQRREACDCKGIPEARGVAALPTPCVLHNTIVQPQESRECEGELPAVPGL